MSPEEYVKEAVVNRGMTLKFLSDKTGVKYSFVQPSVNGGRKFRADEYLKICAFLGIEPRMDVNKEETV